MGSITFGASTSVPQLRQRVVLGGRRREDVYCTSVALGTGTAGSTASLVAPALDWDDKRGLHGETLEVYAGYAGGAEHQVFAGYVDQVGGSQDGNLVELSARSVIGLAGAVYVGQAWIARHGGVVEYPQLALRDGVLAATGWTVKSILRDIFDGGAPTWRGGGGAIPAGWAARIRLGDLGTLDDAFNAVVVGDVEFRQASLAEALEDLLGRIGTVAFRERFSGGTTYLDFFEIGDPGAPVRTVRAVRPGAAIAGTNVLTMVHEDSVEEMRNRVIALGAARKLVISVTTEHETAPLERLWNTAHEAAVLASPARGTVPSQAGVNPGEWVPGYENVFRRYRLPECVRRRLIDQANAVELSDGSTVPIQIWKRGLDLEFDAETGYWVSEAAAAPTMLQGASLNIQTGVIELRDQAINLEESFVDTDNNPIDVWVEAVVGVTLTVNGPRLGHDTGLSGDEVDLAGIGTDGLAEIFANESFGFRQLGTGDWPLEDSRGETHAFDTTTMLVGNEWVITVGADVLQDDEAALAQYAELAARERGRVRAGYQVQTPFFQPGYRVGDRIDLVGQDDFVARGHQIGSITHDLTNDHGTAISTSTDIPMVASQVLGSSQ